MLDTSVVPILVIVGPTASGKTSLAVEICEHLNGEIIGADSIQVYRGFDIGSAKPSKESLRGIRHHMIDIIDPDQDIDAAVFATLADKAIEETVSRGSIPVVTGGTGLWIRALTRGLVKVPQVDRQLRTKLEQEWHQYGKQTLYYRLAKVDPRSAMQIHINDRMRVVRALEVYEQTGIPLGEIRHRHALGKPRYNALTIYIELPFIHLDKRLHIRTHNMINSGWIPEVETLLDTFGPNIRPLSSVGYKEIVDHITHAIPLDKTEQQIVHSTRLYAKRQRTWFRGTKDIDINTTPEKAISSSIYKRIQAHFKQIV